MPTDVMGEDWIFLLTVVMAANFFMLLFLFVKIGGFDNSIEWKYIKMGFALLLRKKISVKPHIQHYSPNQADTYFYLMKTYKCSNARFFKIISGGYTTIVPETEIHELDNKPFKSKI